MLQPQLPAWGRSVSESVRAARVGRSARPETACVLALLPSQTEIGPYRPGFEDEEGDHQDHADDPSDGVVVGHAVLLGVFRVAGIYAHGDEIARLER